MSIAIGVNGRRQRLMEGWNQICPTLGAHAFEGVGAVRFSSHRGQWLKLQVFDWEAEGYLPPRGILTIRRASRPPTLGLLRPHDPDWAYNGPGGFGIAPCGEPGTVLDHDEVMQNHPVSLASMATGTNPASVATYGMYSLSRGWYLATTLPAYSEPTGDMYEGRTKPLRLETIPDRALADRVDALLPYDGQHLIRAMRFALLHRSDPVVQLDLRAMAADAAVAWDSDMFDTIASGPARQGHAWMGREFGWVAYLAGLAGSRALVRRLRAIAAHTQALTGMLQRKVEGEFYGSPHPWSAAKDGGSEVPHGVIVGQDIEDAILVVGLDWLGMPAASMALWRASGKRPGKKWIDVASGAGVGIHGPDQFHPWMAIGTMGLLAKREAQEAARHYRIPDASGSLHGPYKTMAEVRSALAAWGNPGLARWAMERL